MTEYRKHIVFALMAVLLLSITAAGCLTIGYEFRVDAVSRIRIGETTRLQISDIFGQPWRTGIEDGKTTWTYAHYRYSMLGESMTRDLVIRFDEKGVVTSYTFNSSYPEDQRR
jgi:outer membrane protein assembly factor BamE (lipoprotein component of BamABCDE complex)